MYTNHFEQINRQSRSIVNIYFCIILILGTFFVVLLFGFCAMNDMKLYVDREKHSVNECLVKQLKINTELDKIITSLEQRVSDLENLAKLPRQAN